MLAYRPLSTPLHTARAGVAALWMLALLAVDLALDQPLVLAALTLALMAAGALAGGGRRLAGAARGALFVALPLVAVNVIVSRRGLTVFARLGDLGPFGQGQLTLEALVYGIVVALKLAVAMLVCALASLAIDPDELLRGVRRMSFRSALTVSLATRMMGVLGADAQRLAQAQRTRPDAAAARPLRRTATLLSAVASRSLDRALDVAATLELRGFALRRGAAPQPVAWSRHDLAFAASTLAIAALAVLGRLTGAGTFSPYPLLRLRFGATSWALCAALAAAVLAPFFRRRGTGR